MSKNEVNINELSVEQLEEVLKRKKKQEIEERQMKKAVYEQDRDRLVDSSIQRAKVLHDQMIDFKQWAYEQLENFRAKAHEYGDIRANSKGGFSLRHSETQEMVVLERNSIPEYDERASMAEDLLKEFLENSIKKKDKATFRTITALMEKNKQGDFTPGRIANLLKIEDNYDDERWKKAMQLFRESFRIREISYSVSFYTKDDLGKDRSIVLTFSSIPVKLTETTEETKKQ